MRDGDPVVSVTRGTAGLPGGTALARGVSPCDPRVQPKPRGADASQGSCHQVLTPIQCSGAAAQLVSLVPRHVPGCSVLSGCGHVVVRQSLWLVLVPRTALEKSLHLSLMDLIIFT